MIEDAVYALVIGIPEVAAIVETRVYPDAAPDNENVDTQLTRQPYIVYFTVGDPTEEVLEGSSSLQSMRFQFNLFAPTARICRELRDALKKELSPYRGISAGVNLQAIDTENGFSTYQAATRQYVYGLDARFIYSNYWKD